MTMSLVRYEAACRALAEATRVDEVKDIRDKAIAMQAYAAQAKDTQLIGYATEIRLRAERRAGEMLAEMKENGGRQTAGRPEINGSAALPLLGTLGVTKTQSSRWQQLAKLAEEKFEERLRRAKLAAENSTTSAPGYSKVDFSGDFEWYTPPFFIDLAREVLGEIDLDPASCEQAQETVKAKAYFAKADDGLTKEWRGCIWLNPPYAQPYIVKFVEKMVEEYEGGRIHQAIMLTHNYTDTEWFHIGSKHCTAICFTRGRIKFVNKDGDTGQPSQGQAFFYFGNLPLQFKAVFETIGCVWTR
jgi:ParB family chromosome partitioning protein